MRSISKSWMLSVLTTACAVLLTATTADAAMFKYIEITIGGDTVGNTISRPGVSQDATRNSGYVAYNSGNASNDILRYDLATKTTVNMGQASGQSKRNISVTDTGIVTAYDGGRSWEWAAGSTDSSPDVTVFGGFQNGVRDANNNNAVSHSNGAGTASYNHRLGVDYNSTSNVSGTVSFDYMAIADNDDMVGFNAGLSQVWDDSANSWGPVISGVNLMDINSSGIATGSNSAGEPIMYNSNTDTVTAMPLVGGFSTGRGQDINEHGQVVGFNFGSPHTLFFWSQQAGLLDLNNAANVDNLPGEQLNNIGVSFISNGGIITGLTESGKVFILVPEPATLGLLTLGGLLILRRQRRV